MLSIFFFLHLPSVVAVVGPADTIHQMDVGQIGAVLIQARPGLFKHVGLRHQGQTNDK